MARLELIETKVNPMPSIPHIWTDQIIFGNDISVLMSILNGQQWRLALRDLRRTEPALAAYVLNAGDTLAMSLSAQGCSPEVIRTTEEFVCFTMLVVAGAVRAGHQRLMSDFLPQEDKDKEAQP